MGRGRGPARTPVVAAVAVAAGTAMPAGGTGPGQTALAAVATQWPGPVVAVVAAAVGGQSAGWVTAAGRLPRAAAVRTRAATTTTGWWARWPTTVCCCGPSVVGMWAEAAAKAPATSATRAWWRHRWWQTATAWLPRWRRESHQQARAATPRLSSRAGLHDPPPVSALPWPTSACAASCHRWHPATVRRRPRTR